MITTIILIALALIAVTIAFLIRYNLGKATEGFKTDEFRRQMDFHIPPPNLFALCLESLRVINGYEIEYQNKDEGKIISRLPMSCVSSGETITFQITKKDNMTLLSVLAVPLFSSPVYNFHNSERIMEYLNTHREQK